MNVSLIIMEGNYGSIDANYYIFHGYYIIKFSSSPYTLQADLSIDFRVISSGEMVCEENYIFSINMNSRYYVFKKINLMKKIISLSTIIESNVNIIFYYSKDFVPHSLRSISQNDNSILSPRHVPMEEHYNIMDETN